jgi:putative membrane protein
MKKLVLAAALTALAAPVRAQTVAPMTTVPNNAGQATVSAATKAFVANVAMTDMFEIAAGHLAVKKADGPAYLDFAQLMVADHTSTSEQLKKVVADLQGVQLPPALDGAHKAQLDQLGTLSGTAFEHQYRIDQIDGHRRAIAMFDNYATSGDGAELKRWAARTLPILKSHLAHAEALPDPAPAPTTGSGAAGR